MQQEKDFLEREIQRLSLVLKTLTDKIIKSGPEGQDEDFEDVNNSLRAEFGFSIESFGELEQPDLIIKMKDIQHSQIDELIELLYLLVKNSRAEFKTRETKIKSVDNIIFLTEYANQHSSTFSLERMRIESNLRLLKEQ